MNTRLHSETSLTTYRQGLVCAVAAFACWGLFPLYWRLLADVPAVELVCHRIVWSFAFLAIVTAGSRRSEYVKQVSLSNIQIGLIYTFAAVLISINWFVFIWAVNHGRVIEASLGYYINPLFSVLLGVFWLGERLSSRQAIAIGTAACGVVVMVVAGGVMPWISLALAASFALYGLVKKAAPLSSMMGLLIETAVLLVPALVYLLAMEASGGGAIQSGSVSRLFLLMLGGCITVLPLALFATAAQRVSLSTMGVLQYIGPTLQFMVGILIFGEPFGLWRLAGFVLVWCGSLLFLFSCAKGSGRRST